MYAWRSLLALLVLAGASTAKFSLDDLTPEEIAILQAEMEEAYTKQLSESNATESENGDDAGEGDEGNLEDGMEALNDMMADLLQKALASEAMKEILRKRIAEGTLTDLASSGEEGQSENATAGGVSEDKDKAEGADGKDYWEEKDEL